MSDDEINWRGPRLSDRELLLSIGRDLQRVYADTLRQPIPDDIDALLRKIGQAERESKLQEQ